MFGFPSALLVPGTARVPDCNVCHSVLFREGGRRLGELSAAAGAAVSALAVAASPKTTLTLMPSSSLHYRRRNRRWHICTWPALKCW